MDMDQKEEEEDMMIKMEMTDEEVAEEAGMEIEETVIEIMEEAQEETEVMIEEEMEEIVEVVAGEEVLLVGTLMALTINQTSTLTTENPVTNLHHMLAVTVVAQLTVVQPRTLKTNRLQSTTNVQHLQDTTTSTTLTTRRQLNSNHVHPQVDL